MAGRWSLPTTHTVASADGTPIEYLTQGRGAPIIIVPGVLSTASDFARLAHRLSREFTVHRMNRRGRAGSGPQGADYSLAKECADLHAVMKATGAQLVFGHSYGGLIALELARRDPSLAKIAVYEPGVPIGGSIATGWLDTYQRLVDQGKDLDAFAYFSIATGPKAARRIPQRLMKLLLPLFVGRQRLKEMLKLLPENLREHRAQEALNDTYEAYRNIEAQVLLMSGTRLEIEWVPNVMEKLQKVIPVVTVQSFKGLDHMSPITRGPKEIARAIAAHLEGK